MSGSGFVRSVDLHDYIRKLEAEVEVLRSSVPKALDDFDLAQRLIAHDNDLEFWDCETPEDFEDRLDELIVKLPKEEMQAYVRQAARLNRNIER